MTDKPRKGPAMYQRTPLVNQVVNVITSPISKGYQLKTPALYDFYQGEYPINWAKLKAEGPLAVVWQATFGRRGRRWNGKPDDFVHEFVAEAKANNVKYGLYHFLTPNSISEQADFYIKTVLDLGGLGNMPPILDIEWEPGYKDNPRGKDWAYQIKTWLDRVETYFKMKPIIYTSAKFWSFTYDHFGNPPPWSWHYPLWTAGYPFTIYVDANKTCPPGYIPKGWTKADIWQYAEDGRYRGFSANDLNQVYNTELIK